MKAVLWGVGVLVLVVLAVGGYWFYSLQQAAVQWDKASEIASESIEQEGNTWKIRFTSVIDKPLDRVWQAVQQPERSAEFIDSFKKSELKKHEGNKKVIEMQVQLLTLPIQTALLEFTFDEANKQVSVKTLVSAAQDLSATYKLDPSPDGTKTLFSYAADARAKVSVPLPVSSLKGAFKEQFVKTVRAIKKGVEQQDQQQQQQQQQQKAT
jgi:carbon monoxide dehydrogenase subunit G